jgi:hypothetical protein
MEKRYTKPSRFNPRLSFEQYQIVLERKRRAKQDEERVRYKDLTQEWGVRPSIIGSAVHKGIKQYDYLLWKAEIQPLRTTTPVFVRNSEQRPDNVCTQEQPR